MFPRRSSLKKAARCLLAIELAIPVVSQSIESVYQSVLVFGDSYSDNCNGWRTSHQDDDKLAFPNCPPPPKGRFSGNLAWPELLANDRPDLDVINHAVAGATCDNSQLSRGIFLDVKNQIASFSSSASDLDSDRTLVVIWIGTNEMVLFKKALHSATKLNVTPEDASGAVFEQIDTLQSMGFNDFLLVDLIPLEYSRQLGTSTTHDQMADLVKRYNAAHQSRVSELQTDGKNIQLFSAHNLWQQVIDDPSQYMASPQPIEQVCRNRPGHEGGKPDDCTGYFFFDGLHPTQAMWQIMVPRLIETMQDSARVKHDHDEISRALSLLKRKDDLWIVMASAFVASSWGALAGFASLTVLATGIISASRTYFKRNSASAIQLQLTPRPDNQV